MKETKFMIKIRQVFASLLTLVMLFSIAPNSSAKELSVTIEGGDFTMVPGDFSVLRINPQDGLNLKDVTWGVDQNHVVNIDSKTGRVDAIGTGKATITLTALDENDNRHEATSEVTVSGGPTPIIEPIPELQNNNRPDFMMGADVSSLYQIMEANKKYYDLNGKEAHLFDILAENGVNWVRLRVWNNPYDEFGNPYGGGNSNIDTTIELAKQAKERDMKVLVVFHYSDFWAHPGQQKRPAEWSNLTGQDLIDAVGNFTAESLIKMRDAGSLSEYGEYR